MKIDLAVVVVLRHPLEVAHSLAATRERIPIDEGLALWERSLRGVLRDCGEMPVLVTDYSDLITVPSHWCDQTTRFLADAGAALSFDDHVLRGFLDGGLRHHSVEDLETGTDAALTTEQSALWEIAVGLKGTHSRFQSPGLPRESPSTSALLGRNLPGTSRRFANSWYRTLRRYGLPPLGIGS